MRKLLILALTGAACTPIFAQSSGWSHGQIDDKTARWAAVSNDSNGRLTQRCEIDREECYWSFATTTQCKKGADFPVLVNSDVGSFGLSVSCGSPVMVDGSTYYQYFFDFYAVDKLIRGSDRIGIAVALESDNFRIIRFDLTNAVKVIDRMRALALEEIKKRPKKKSTRDQVL